VVQDVLIANNVVRNVSSAINILGRDTRFAAVEASRITIRNNLFANVSGAAFGGSGRVLLINGASQVAFDHNTAIADGQSAIFADGHPSSGFVLTNNLLADNGLAIKGNATGAGLATIGAYFPGATVLGNVIAGASPGAYPGGNHYPPPAAIGFENFGAGDYRLSAASPYKGMASDGTDPGCNFAALGGLGGAVAPLGPLAGGFTGEAPSAPQGLAAQVSGATVTLTWTAPPSGLATGYILEAGSAPGLSNAARAPIGPGTSLVVHAVPANRYYVRVIAINGAARSGPSNEIVVTVR
jgi:hypothetical protein